jgi:predicted dinucleotide-utilizing enzyme
MAVKVGIIGCGSIAEFRHAPEYANNPRAEIIAYYDPKTERAERLAGLYGGNVVDDYKKSTILLPPMLLNTASMSFVKNPWQLRSKMPKKWWRPARDLAKS